MKYEISEELLNALLQYLSSRPYAEVYKAVAELQQLQKIDKKLK